MRARLRTSVCFTLFLLLGAVSASAQELWSNPATWGGQVPGPGAHVVIPQARRIILDVSPPPLGSITVIGALAFAEQDIDLTVGWIMVHGLLEIGTEQVPFEHHVNITLNGPLDTDQMGMGARFIGAMGGGTLEIHGARRADVDWAVLDGHANPGDTTINLALIEPNKTSLGWRPGDLLVIAPSGRDPLQVEAVRVTGVSGTQVTFTPPLQYQHWGTLQTIAERTVDERAEVGLLTRNIVIQGASDGYARYLGGHIMIMAGSIGKIEGTELHHMGQRGRKGRYPIHWHLTGYGPTDYARFNSIWTSFQRAIAIHQTHGVEVRGNVAVDIWSHAYVVGEDGNEQGNTVEDNLGILIKRPPDSGFAFAPYRDSVAVNPAAQDEWRPATFWVNNPNNSVKRNRAAGGLDAIGFFYGYANGRIAPGDAYAVDFAGNVAHSYLASNPADDPNPNLASGVGLMVRMAPRASGTTSFASFTAYKNSVTGAWLENAGDVLQDAVLADNASGAIVFRGTIDHAMIVGQTANWITPHPYDHVRGGVRIIGPLGGAKAPQVRRTTFVNQPSAVDVDSDAVMPGNLFEEITRIDTPVPVFLRDRSLDHTWSGGLLDVDGSLTGTGHASMVSGAPLDAESVFMAGWGTYTPGGAFVTPQSTSSGPTGLSSSVEGSTLSLAWYAPDDPSTVQTYVLEAGSASGRADLAQMDVGLTTTQAIPGVPNGTYYLRVRARGADGAVTQASNEVAVTIGEPSCYVPDPPTLTSTLDGQTISVQWNAAAGATSYILGVGSAPGLYNLLVTALPATTTSIGSAVPPGTYVVRMAAQNACGFSSLSNEITIVVP